MISIGIETLDTDDIQTGGGADRLTEEWTGRPIPSSNEPVASSNRDDNFWHAGNMLAEIDA